MPLLPVSVVSGQFSGQSRYCPQIFANLSSSWRRRQLRCEPLFPLFRGRRPDRVEVVAAQCFARSVARSQTSKSNQLVAVNSNAECACASVTEKGSNFTKMVKRRTSGPSRRIAVPSQARQWRGYARPPKQGHRKALRPLNGKRYRRSGTNRRAQTPTGTMGCGIFQPKPRRFRAFRVVVRHGLTEIYLACCRRFDGSPNGQPSKANRHLG